MKNKMVIAMSLLAMLPLSGLADDKGQRIEDHLDNKGDRVIPPFITVLFSRGLSCL